MKSANELTKWKLLKELIWVVNVTATASFQFLFYHLFTHLIFFNSAISSFFIWWNIKSAVDAKFVNENIQNHQNIIKSNQRISCWAKKREKKFDFEIKVKYLKSEGRGDHICSVILILDKNSIIDHIPLPNSLNLLFISARLLFLKRILIFFWIPIIFRIILWLF